MNGRWFWHEISSENVKIVYKSIPEKKLRKIDKEKDLLSIIDFFGY